MRHVVHLAIDADRSDVGARSEGRHDAARMRKVGCRWREARIDGRDLIGVNGDAADETITARDPAAFRKALRILEVTVQCLERLHTRGASREQALGPRDLIGEGPLATGLLVGERAKRRTEILGPPRHGDKPLVRSRITTCLLYTSDA